MRIPQVTERVKEAPAQALRAMFAGIGQVLLVADRMRSRPDGPDEPAVTETRATSAPAKSQATRVAARSARPGAPSAPAAPAAPDQASPADPAHRWPPAERSGNVRLLPPGEAAPSRSTANPVPPKPTSARMSTPQASTSQVSTPPVSTPPVSTGPASAGPDATATVPAPPAARRAPDDEGAPAPEVPAAAAGTAGPARAAAAGSAGPAGSAEPAGAGGPSLPVPRYDELTVASLRARLRNLDRGQVAQLLAFERSHAARPAVITMYERRMAKLDAGAQ